jgi:carbon-monoxide dehydrogenase small subunit
MTWIDLKVNGEARRIDVQPRTHLADLLRETLRFTGTHIGCEQGICGACTVLVDGVPVRSCIVPAVACDGSEVRSIEGLDDDAVTNELREAFRREHGLQCGFCTPGMLIASRDIVLRLPDADERRIRHELSGNLCRCTGYVGIVNAVHNVVEKRRRTGVKDAPVHASVAIGRLREDARAHSAASPAMAVSGSGPSPSVEPARAPTRDAAPASATREGWTQFAESFVVELEPDEAWRTLSDFNLVAACLPGAELTEQSDRYVKGKMTVKLGPIRATFAGSATVELVSANLTGHVRGAGSDSGSGSRTKANATYTVRSNPNGSGSLVSILAEYNLQGPLAQFSRSGVAQDLGRRILGQFAANLNASFRGPAATTTPAGQAPLDAGYLLWSSVHGWWLRLLDRTGLRRGQG